MGDLEFQGNKLHKGGRCRKYIHGLVGINNTQFHLTVVYGLHTISARIPLWTTIQHMSSKINEP